MGQTSLDRFFQTYKEGPGADKWSGYFDSYHSHFKKFRGQEKVGNVTAKGFETLR